MSNIKEPKWSELRDLWQSLTKIPRSEQGIIALEQFLLGYEEGKKLGYSGKEVADMMKGAYRAAKSEIIKCTCSNEIKTGETSVMCCNICGKPVECFWNFPDLIDNDTISKTVDLMRSIIDKMLNIGNPTYSEAELIIINDSITRHMNEEIEGDKMKCLGHDRYVSMKSNKLISKDELRF